MTFNVKDPAHLLLLKNEVNQDPKAVGYVKDGTRKLLFLLHNTQKGGGVVTRPFEELTVSDIVDKIDVAEADALGSVGGFKRAWLHSFIGRPSDEPLRPHRKMFMSLFSRTSRTHVAILAMLNRPGSRIEILFGYGTRISEDDWFIARDS